MALVKNPLLPGPFAVLPGSGGEQFRQLNVMGWQASWKADDPVYAPASTLAAFATPNPALVLDLAPGAPTDALKTEAEKFGKVEEVTQPAGALFAFVRFKETQHAAAFLAAVTSVDGRAVRVQPAKQACAEVTAWRAKLHAKA